MQEQAALYTQMQMRVVELQDLGRVLQNDMDSLIRADYLDHTKLNSKLETFKLDLATFHTKLFKTEVSYIKFMEEKLHELQNEKQLPPV